MSRIATIENSFPKAAKRGTVRSLSPFPVRTFNQDPAATEALEEIVNLYRQADSDSENTERPLSGRDLMDELGIWIERHHKLLRKLGIVEDTIDIEHD